MTKHKMVDVSKTKNLVNPNLSPVWSRGDAIGTRKVFKWGL